MPPSTPEFALRDLAPPAPRGALVASLLPWLRLKIVVGGGIVVLLIFFGIAAPWLAPYDPGAQDLSQALQRPGGAHLLGTDHLGRDILSRVIYGSRVSLVIAGAVALISGVIGVVLGASSGYFGGLVDFFIQKLLEIVWAFPPLLLAIAIVAFFGQSVLILIIALASQRWIPFCRVSRAQALSLKSRDFVTAALSLGSNDLRIIRRHILPNLAQQSLVIGTFAMATAIISEASLSFLGLGVPSDIPTWGSMLADGRTHLSTSWWLAFFPGLCIFTTVLGINLLGDGLRDLLDPRLQRGGVRK
jgi:peptide/nickel transport system permease protein